MTTINDIADAVKAVTVLKDAVAKHDVLLEVIVSKLEQISQRLDALEKRAPRRK